MEACCPLFLPPLLCRRFPDAQKFWLQCRVGNGKSILVHAVFKNEAFKIYININHSCCTYYFVNFCVHTCKEYGYKFEQLLFNAAQHPKSRLFPNLLYLRRNGLILGTTQNYYPGVGLGTDWTYTIENSRGFC